MNLKKIFFGEPETPSYILHVAVSPLFLKNAKAEWTHLRVFKLKKEGLEINWDPKRKDFGQILLDDRYEEKSYEISLSGKSVTFIDKRVKNSEKYYTVFYSDFIDFIVRSYQKGKLSVEIKDFLKFAESTYDKKYFEANYNLKKEYEELYSINYLAKMKMEGSGYRDSNSIRLIMQDIFEISIATYNII